MKFSWGAFCAGLFLGFIVVAFIVEVFTPWVELITSFALVHGLVPVRLAVVPFLVLIGVGAGFLIPRLER